MSASERPNETALYPPIKALLERQGYFVKGEVGAADVVARRGEEPPLIIELKAGFALALFHQAVARQAMTETVYIAVPHGSGRSFRSTLGDNVKLCRRLGLGLMTVRLQSGQVEVHCDPAPYKPRIVKRRLVRLLREFDRRVGDPTKGGTRGVVITAYRQDALRCVHHLKHSGPERAAKVAAATGVSRARTIMADDHYGWFERVERGVYGITEAGARAAHTYDDEISRLLEERRLLPSIDASAALNPL
ncbi:MAG: DUF2161 family putative PD-(D/E)XK-type phosphodiesterase [Pseudomonadota bacterium]